MYTKIFSAALISAALALPTFAETIEVQMLNKGEAGRMLFEPAFVQIAPGDTIQFIATDRSHNAASIDGMAPDGAPDFKGKINEEIAVTFEAEGWYGIQCVPHFAMGMVLTVQVGDAPVPDDFLAGRLPKKAKDRFNDALAMAQ